MELIKILLDKYIATNPLERWKGIYYPMIERRLASKRGLKRMLQKATGVWLFIDKSGLLDTGFVKDPQEEAVLESVIPETSTYTETKSLDAVWAKFPFKKLLQPKNQGNIGTCAVWTIQNLVNQIIAERGLKDVIELDISLMYRDYRWKRGSGEDSGTVVNYLLDQLIKDGVPLRTTQPITNRKDLLALDQDKTIEAGRQFRMHIIESYGAPQAGFEKLMQVMGSTDTFTNKIQISLDVYRHKTKAHYWWNWVVDWVNGMYYTGRHSLMALFMTVNGEKIAGLNNKGKRGILAVDSGDGEFKFITEDYLSKANLTFRVIKVKGNFGKPPVIEVPTPVQTDVLATTVIKYGEESQNVTLLQTYLETQGYFTFKGKKGKFYGVTQRALSAWQRDVLGQDYGGSYWGTISQNAYKTNR